MIKQKSKNTSKLVSMVLGIIFIVVLLAATYLPILVIVIFSFTKTRGFGDWSSFMFTLSPFVDLFKSSSIMTALRNSLIIGFSAAFLATLIGTFSAIGLFHCRKKMRSALEYAGQITMFNADIVTALAMLIFFIYMKIDSEWFRLIIGHTIICLPYTVMSILPRLSQLDPNVYEAGLDLGASPMRTLMTVVLPQLTGGMVSGFALAFTISMDDFTISTFLSNNVNTIPRYLYNNIRRSGLSVDLRALSTVLLVGIMLVLVLINVVQSRRSKKLKSLK